MANLQQLDSVPTACTTSLPHTALPERLRILTEAARVVRTMEGYNCNARKGHMEGEGCTAVLAYAHQTLPAAKVEQFNAKNGILRVGLLVPFL